MRVSCACCMASCHLFCTAGRRFHCAANGCRRCPILLLLTSPARSPLLPSRCRLLHQMAVSAATVNPAAAIPAAASPAATIPADASPAAANHEAILPPSCRSLAALLLLSAAAIAALISTASLSPAPLPAEPLLTAQLLPAPPPSASLPSRGCRCSFASSSANGFAEGGAREGLGLAGPYICPAPDA